MLETALREVMDLSPRGIRQHLDLNKPIYAAPPPTAISAASPRRDGGFSWERTDLVEALKQAIAA